MKRLFKKKWFFFLVLPMLLIFVGLVVIVLSHSLWLPSIVASQIESALGKKTSLQSLSISYSSPTTVNLSQLTIEEMGTVKNLNLTIDIFAALENTFIVPEAVIEGVDLNLVELMSQPPENTSSSAFEIPEIIAQLTLKDIHVIIPEQEITLKKLTLDCDTSQGKLNADLNVLEPKYSDKAGKSWPLAFADLKVTGKSQGKGIVVEDLIFKSTGLSYQMSGAVRNIDDAVHTLKDIHMTLIADFEKVNLALEEMGEKLPNDIQGSLKKEIKLTTLENGQWDVTVTADPNNFKVMDKEKVMISLPNDPFTIKFQTTLVEGKLPPLVVEKISIPYTYFKCEANSIEINTAGLATDEFSFSQLMDLNGKASIVAQIKKAIDAYVPGLFDKLDVAADLNLEVLLKGDKKFQAMTVESDITDLMYQDKDRKIAEPKMHIFLKSDIRHEQDVYSLTQKMNVESTTLDLKVEALVNNLEALKNKKFEKSRDNLLNLKAKTNIASLQGYGLKDYGGVAEFDVKLKGGVQEGQLTFDFQGNKMEIPYLKKTFETRLNFELQANNKEDVTTTHIKQLNFKGPDVMTLMASGSIENKWPFDLKNSQHQLDFKINLPGTGWVFDNFPQFQVQGLSYGKGVTHITAQHDKTNPDHRFDLSNNLESVSFENESILYEGSIDNKIIAKVNLDTMAVDVERMDLTVNKGEEVLLSTKATGKYLEGAWKTNVTAQLRLNQALNLLKDSTITKDLLIADELMNITVKAEGKPDEISAEGRVEALLKLKTPQFRLNHPLTLDFQVRSSSKEQVVDTLTLAVGEGKNNFLSATVQDLAQVEKDFFPFRGSGQVKIISDQLVPLMSEEMRKGLGELDLNGPLALTFSSDGGNMLLDCDLTNTQLLMSTLLNKPAGMPFAVSYDSKKEGDITIKLDQQSINGNVTFEEDFKVNKLLLKDFDLELVPLANIFPVLKEYQPTGQLLGGFEGDLLGGVGALTLKQCQFMLPAEKKKMPMALDGAVEVSMDNYVDLPLLKLNALKVGLGRSQLNISGSLKKNKEIQTGALSISGPLLDVDEILNNFASAEAEPTEKKTGQKIDQQKLSKLLDNKEMTFDWKVNKLIYSEIPITDSKVSLSIKNQRLDLSELSGGVNEGSVKMQGYKDFIGKKTVHAKTMIKEVQLTQDLIDKSANAFWLFDLIKTVIFKIVPGVEGNLNGNIVITSAGLETEELISSAEGAIDLLVKNARVKNPVWLKNLGSAIKALATALEAKDPTQAESYKRIATILADPQYEEVVFKTTIKDQVATVTMDFISHKGLAGLKVTGNIQLNPKSPEISACAFLVQITKLSDKDNRHYEKITQALFGQTGFVLGDSLNNLTIAIDQEAILKALIKEVVTDKIKEKIGDKIGDIIGGILGGKKKK